MAPIPTIQKNRPQQPRQVVVSTDDVYDELGRSLTSLQRKQRRTDNTQTDNITVNRQHAQQYESKTSDNKLVYRDVFPGRKYKLTLSDITWITGSNTVTIGWTVGDTFTSINYDQDGNVFSFELGNEPAIDTVEVRLVGASSTVRGYLEDCTSASGILNKIAQILEDIIGLGNRIDAIETAVGIPYTGTDSLDDRVTALENE